MAVVSSTARGARFIDLTGRKFGRLTAKTCVKDNRSRLRWVCICDCGNTKTIRANHLSSGRSRNCGCLNVEVQKQSFQKHGGAAYDKSKRHPLYSTWCGMKKRCYTPTCTQFEFYGGRGIEVCAEWRHDFQRFVEDMGPKPSTRHTLDRYPDNDGNYEPGNCRWATKSEQMKNRRKYHRRNRNGSIAQPAP